MIVKYMVKGKVVANKPDGKEIRVIVKDGILVIRSTKRGVFISKVKLMENK